MYKKGLFTNFCSHFEYGNQEILGHENMKLSRKSKSEFGPNKKNVYLSLPFKGDIQDEILTKRLTHAVKNTFHAGTS